MEPSVQRHRETYQYVSQPAGDYEHSHEQEAPVEPASPRVLRAVDPGSVRAGHGQVLRYAAGPRTLQNLEHPMYLSSVTHYARRMARNFRELSKQETMVFLSVIPRV